MTYTYAQIDPRPQSKESNEAIFAEGAVYGVEVTLPAYSARCLSNLDHHGPEDTAETPSACEQAMSCSLPPDGATLATVRCDADSLTAMAILASRSEGRSIDTTLVEMIGEMDRLGPKSPAGSDPKVIAIARKSEDFKTPLPQRVEWIQTLLEGADLSEEVEALVAARDAEFAAAEKASAVSLVADGRICVVESTHRFATNLGYSKATVVVAMNPQMQVNFKDPTAGTYKKFTVCRYDSHVPCDLPAALKELQSLEEGWGGRGDIFGSPQGISSELSIETVVEVVQRHLK